MADVELLPLPPSPLVQMSWDGPGAEVRHTTLYTADQMRAYTRANLAPLQAENERLRAEVEGLRAERMVVIENHAYWKARADRLAEALRTILKRMPRSTAGPAWIAREIAAAALAQEDRNG